MSDANNEQLRPPPSWDKFEEICADLFSRIWKDNQLVRYGRAGQRQHGVDIYGKDSGADAAVQCKGKRDWPPTKLTIPEIDAEIQEAKKFNPPLSTYILATTADNDVYITDHVNAVSAKHAEQGLFRVCPTNVSTDGWNFGDSACGRGGAFLSARTVPQLSWGTHPGKQASKCLNLSN